MSVSWYYLITIITFETNAIVVHTVWLTHPHITATPVK